MPKTIVKTNSLFDDSSNVKTVKNTKSSKNEAVNNNIIAPVDKSITTFLDTDYRDFSVYVIKTRACPKLTDGLRIGARKLLYSAFVGGLKDGSEKKVPTLVGDCYVHTQFQHGDTSLVGTIISMGAFFENNLNPIDIVGQGGSLRAPDATAAPRYLFCKLSKYAKLVYKIDEDMLDYVFDEGEYLEPTTYLPIIPTVICGRNEGMAPGYRFSSFSYNPVDVIDACIAEIKGKPLPEIRPYVRGIKQTNFVKDVDTDKYYNIGEYDIKLDNDELIIRDLPYDAVYGKFENKLNKLVDSGYIKDWSNYSHDDIIEYHIYFNKTQLKRLTAADKIDDLKKKLMLKTVVPNDMLYVLNEHDKVVYFKNRYDLLKYFVNVRLGKYNNRKDKLVNVKEEQLKNNTKLCQFITLVTSGKLKINNRPVNDVKADMDKHELPYTLLSIPVSRLTLEEKDAILKKNMEIEKELEYIKNTTPEQMYLDDLNELKRNIKNDFA